MRFLTSTLLVALPLAIGSSVGAANPPTWMVDRGASSVSFKYVENGRAKHGTFNTFMASIAFDPNSPEDASASFVVETASIDLNDGMREGVLATVPWFDSERFPRAEFRLTKLRPTTEGKFVADGVLKIKAVKLPVQLTLSFLVDGEKARAMGSLEIDRTDFRLRDAVLEAIVGIGERVTINFDLIATPELK